MLYIQPIYQTLQAIVLYLHIGASFSTPDDLILDYDFASDQASLPLEWYHNAYPDKDTKTIFIWPEGLFTNTELDNLKIANVVELDEISCEKFAEMTYKFIFKHFQEHEIDVVIDSVYVSEHSGNKAGFFGD
mgnify:CR=1 FL=1